MRGEWLDIGPGRRLADFCFGLFSGPFLTNVFAWFSEAPGGSLGSLLGPFGLPLGAFWLTFWCFLVLGGVCENQHPSRAESLLTGCWGVPGRYFFIFFPHPVLGSIFNRVFIDFCSPRDLPGGPWGSFGRPRGAHFRQN